MENEALLSKITDEYSAKLLNWAIRKTGSRPDGEELAQEVLLQVFMAASRQKIDKLENFIWKLAHYVWCNHLRQLKRNQAFEISEVIPDDTDFTKDYIEKEALEIQLAVMRRKISDLSRLQREVTILHYLDGLSVKEIAVKLGLSESTVTWHLFDARNRMRKELLETMKEEKSVIYRPGKLFLGYSGEAPAYPDTQKINDSLIRQNLCLLCHSDGKTIDELSEATGIPKTFLEYDLDWLTEHEFLTLTGRRYYTTFLILNQKYFENRNEIYQSSKKEYIDIIIDALWKNEDSIRSIGFHGSEFPAGKLYWSIIMMFISFCSRNSELMLKLKNRDKCEIRPDGGKYYVMAADRSDGVKSGFSHLPPMGWNDFYGICSDSCQTNGRYDSYYWLGVYNFSDRKYHPEIISATPEIRQRLHKVYCSVLRPDFSINNLTKEEQEKLAQAVECGLITKTENGYLPNFVIFTPEQLSVLQMSVFAPLLKKIEPQMQKIGERFFKYHKNDFPKASECGIEHHVYMDLWDFGIYTMIFAAQENRLSLPEVPESGVPFTMVLVK